MLLTKINKKIHGGNENMKNLVIALKCLTRAPHEVLTLVCQGPSLYLKHLVKKGHNSKTIACFQNYAPCLVLHMHSVMTSKYSKFDVDSFNTF